MNFRYRPALIKNAAYAAKKKKVRRHTLMPRTNIIYRVTTVVQVFLAEHPSQSSVKLPRRNGRTRRNLAALRFSPRLADCFTRLDLGILTNHPFSESQRARYSFRSKPMTVLYSFFFVLSSRIFKHSYFDKNTQKMNKITKIYKMFDKMIYIVYNRKVFSLF
jgi:hypothetical protein